jgi:hypothetical protein
MCILWVPPTVIFTELLEDDDDDDYDDDVDGAIPVQ